MVILNMTLASLWQELVNKILCPTLAGKNPLIYHATSLQTCNVITNLIVALLSILQGANPLYLSANQEFQNPAFVDENKCE